MKCMMQMAFVTGTPFCILPVCRLNNLNIGDGKFGEISKKLLKQWSDNVGLDIIKQMKNYYEEFNNIEKENTTSIYQFKKSK